MAAPGHGDSSARQLGDWVTKNSAFSFDLILGVPKSCLFLTKGIFSNLPEDVWLWGTHTSLWGRFTSHLGASVDIIF